LDAPSNTTPATYLLRSHDGDFDIRNSLTSTTALTIDSSGNVGIGGSTTTGWANKQVVLDAGANASAAFVMVNDTTGRTATDGSVITLSGSDMYLIQRESANMIFRTANTERMRIDSSGNFLVGKTSADNGATVGLEYTAADKLYVTDSASSAIVMNRLASDGNIAVFQKDGTTAGSIGIESGGFYIDGEAAHSGLSFGGNSVVARDNGTRVDNTVDLGSSVHRFKDLYLSGSISTNSTGGLSITSNATNRGILNLSASTAYQLIGGGFYGYTGYKTGGYHRWFGSDGGEDMRIDSSGNLLVGGTTTTAIPALDKGIHLLSSTNGDVIGYSLYANEGTNNRRASFFLDDTNGVYGFDTTASSGVCNFVVNSAGTERMRINSEDITMSGTGSLTLPKGTTAQRPSSPVNGMIRYNTTLDATEEYRGGAWVTLSSVLNATGGTITDSGGYKIHTFTSSGTFEIISGSGDIEFLVIAGGGGGSGRDVGGGGGAGGYRCSVSGESSGGGGSAETSLTLGKGSYTVTVGAGGAGGADGGVAAQGNDSVFATITSIGGGGARSYNVVQPDDAGGGSGGGGAGITYLTAGSGTSNQGYSGGDGASGSESTYGGGGGGGAGAAGAAAGSAANVGTRNGGDGVASSITGSSVTRAGGGGGAGHRTQGNGTLGAGGAGGGASATATAGTDSNRNGTANTGGGAGASKIVGGTGGTGGSGIVIVRYIP
jgi:hypothetical protein